MAETQLMSQHLDFDITSEDVECGKRHNPSGCPAALAIKRTLSASNPGLLLAVRVTRGATLLEIGEKETLVSFRNPAELKEFILQFDVKGPSNVKPGRFRLERYEEPTEI